MQSYFEQEDWYRDFLTADEHVLWTGKSERLFHFYPIYLFLIPFMTAWFGGVITATVTIFMDAIRGEDSPFFLLILVPFWAGGSFFIYMLFIRPIRLRKYTRYAVTNKRVMEYYRGSFNAVYIGSFTPIRISKTSRGGTGTITVGYQSSQYSSGQSLTIPVQNNGIIEITDVAEPQKVYNLIVSQGET